MKVSAPVECLMKPGASQGYLLMTIHRLEMKNTVTGETVGEVSIEVGGTKIGLSIKDENGKSWNFVVNTSDLWKSAYDQFEALEDLTIKPHEKKGVS
jgi:hypothetical protein